MPILGTDAYRFSLMSALADARASVSLISAFITVPGIEWVLEHLSPSVTSLRVLARWNCGDLVAGASDLEVYTILNERGAHFFIMSDLHAKISLVDDRTLLLGSANLTNFGLRLVPGGNREIGISISPTTEDIQVINTLFDEAVELYRRSRQAGVTPRSSVDCLIAACALRHGLTIVHRDRDFSGLARISSLAERDIQHE